MSSFSLRFSRIAIVAWLAFLIACGVVISRTQFTTDLSAFLPRSPTPEQQLLLDQIRDGLASRIILVDIEGENAPTRARLSKQLAQKLRLDPAFISVNNGEPVTTEQDRAYLFNHRYLLSPAVTPERFSVTGLHASLSESIDLLASPAGLLVKSLLPRDPTGEMMQLLGQFNNSRQPPLFDGAWTSRDGMRAVLLIQTRASGADTDAQQLAMTTIQQTFKTAAGATSKAKLDMTGPGVFSVKSRDTIQAEVSWLSILSVALIAALLLAVYRSLTALILGFLPVITGALAGIAAVSLGFGAVHGITLGFGTALIGEAVDYSIYLFVQSEKNTDDQQHWVKRFWPTIRLGVLTSIVGFASLLWSGFPGLAQLGLYSIAGLVTAAVVTRYVLPHLLPTHFRIHDVSAVGKFLSQLVQRAATLRWPAVMVLLLALVILIQHRDRLWNDKISSLSPVSQAEINLDASLRADTGAPDVRYLVVVSGASREDVLKASEQVSAVLKTQVDQGYLAGFESPSRYLPSLASQRLRQTSLPAISVLQSNLEQATQGLPVKSTLFTPFLGDVAAASKQPLLQAADLEKTSMQMALDALLIQQGHHWSALLPLTAFADKEIDALHIRAQLKTLNQPSVMFLDMKLESDNLYSGYLNEAIALSLSGLAGIIGLLLIVFRSPVRVARIIAPLAAAVITVTAGLALFGHQLIILHLIGLLLVVAVGSNYALFFDQKGTDSTITPNTLASMLFANLTTVAGFGLLAFSNVSILQAMGITVAPGVILALFYAAIFARISHA
ncbi:MAG: MMPL family transporter [Burkholderiaceae bacterium]|nr:MMPL family transporter [Burkholderiaceae bacterium]